jgi:hypothetical protein
MKNHQHRLIDVYGCRTEAININEVTIWLAVRRGVPTLAHVIRLWSLTK